MLTISLAISSPAILALVIIIIIIIIIGVLQYSRTKHKRWIADIVIQEYAVLKARL